MIRIPDYLPEKGPRGPSGRTWDTEDKRLDDLDWSLSKALDKIDVLERYIIILLEKEEARSDRERREEENQSSS